MTDNIKIVGAITIKSKFDYTEPTKFEISPFWMHRVYNFYQTP